jgi:hypothetical protein
MLDSGAFSAFKKGEEIDLKAYAKYIKAHADLWFSYVTLDVLPAAAIGSSKRDVDNLRAAERFRTNEAIEAAAKQSQRNHYKLRDMGLTPIPVFHQGESFKWLEQMLADKEPYIGISAIKSAWNEPEFHRKWFDECWKLIPKETKVHGFGITGGKFLIEYPWFSTDSTTWSKCAGYGRIYVPLYEFRGGVPVRPLWNRKGFQVTVSGFDKLQDSSWKWRKSKRGHVEAMGEQQRLMIDKFLTDEVGISLAQARYSSDLRRRAVLIYYLRMCEAVGVKLMFATSILNRRWAILMNEVGATNRLLSYYELRHVPDELVYQFVQQGISGEHKKLIPKMDWTSEQYLNFRRLRQEYVGLTAPDGRAEELRAGKCFDYEEEESAEEGGAPF